MADSSLLIRNFCFIAHIDHGKSTLADRMLQLTKTINARNFHDQVLDSMELERERGISIKSHPVTMYYKANDGFTYAFNLLDTPGHVDFTYEVSRSMAACEGAILIVDAAQGIEAQTIANAQLAREHNLEIIPVLNKIDLPTANLEETSRQLENILGLPIAKGCMLSAKTGYGVQKLMELIVEKIPAPQLGNGNNQKRALVFDSNYDSYRGVVPYIRVIDGHFKPGNRIVFLKSGCISEIKEVGIFSPNLHPLNELQPGQVGYFIGTIKDPQCVRIGDTISSVEHRTIKPVPGFKQMQPMVFSAVYPVNSADYEKLRTSIGRLSLNDSAFTYEQESSTALGVGFRCGFLGLLHMEIVQERLRREYNCDIISTYPAVLYQIILKKGSVKEIENPLHMPDQTEIAYIKEPVITARIICRNEDISDVLKLVMDRRGKAESTDSLDTKRVMLTCVMPLNEIIIDFYDCLKSISHGYASMDYEFRGYVESDIVKLNILLNGQPVDAFSRLIHRLKAEAKGRQMCRILKEAIPKHLFAIPIQCAIHKTIIARETIKPLRKDVTAKCYGGDITRKRKLLGKQKEGKKKMKKIGRVHVPQEVFISVLRAT